MSRKLLDRVLPPAEEVLGSTFRSEKYFCATLSQMLEDLIKPHLAYHFEPKPNVDFKLVPS